MTEHGEGSDGAPEEPDDRDKPPASGAAEPALPPKRFVAAEEEELDPQSYIVSDDRTAATATLRHGSIGTNSGDAKFIGEAIEKFAGVLREAAQLYKEGVTVLANPLLRGFAFGHSVTLEFTISEIEEVQTGLDGAKHSPTIDAARAVRELVAADPNELRERAIRVGPNATNAYKSFLNLLAKDDVTFELQVPDVSEVVVITSDHARRDATILAQEGERATQPLTLSGTLTMADSELKQFKLTLPPDVERPPLLKGKHRVSGTYSDEVGQKLKDENLWNSEVTATIEASYDLPGTTAIPRGATFRLVDAEPLIPPPTLFDT